MINAADVKLVTKLWTSKQHLEHLMKNICCNSQSKTHTRRAGAALMWSLSLRSCHRVCFWTGGGWKPRKRGGGNSGRGRTQKEVDYLLGLLQRHLQPAYFLLVLLLHLVDLVVVSGDLLLQGSFQGGELPLPPLQHIFLLLLGQENLLQLQLQMHHVLLKSDR